MTFKKTIHTKVLHEDDLKIELRMNTIAFTRAEIETLFCPYEIKQYVRKSPPDYKNFALGEHHDWHRDSINDQAYVTVRWVLQNLDTGTKWVESEEPQPNIWPTIPDDFPRLHPKA